MRSSEMEQESTAMYARNSSSVFGSAKENVGASDIEETYLEMLHTRPDVIESIEENQSESNFINPQDLLPNDSNVQTEGSGVVSNTFSILSEIPSPQIGYEMLHQISTKNHELFEIFPIEKFSNFPHVLKKDCTLSPGCSSIWTIELMIGKSIRRAICFELQGKLIRNGKENGTLRTNLQIALTDSNNQVLYDSVFSSLSSSELLPSTSWFSMLLHEKHIYPLSDDKLNVCLVLKVKDCCLTNDISETIENNDDGSFYKMLLGFQNDLRTAYESKLLHDFCLVVGVEAYSVNKFVLCARSPVFSNLFGLRTKPQTFYRLDPACKTKEVIHAFLLYLYTGIIDDLDMDTACGLYTFATEFKIITLSPACGHIMLSKLTPENACKVLILVHRNRDVFLKDAALRYIKKHITEAELTRDWQFLSRNLPILKSEIQTFFKTS